MIRIRKWNPLFACAVGLCLASTTATDLVRAAEPTGMWKFVVLAMGDEDFAIVDLHRQDGQPRGVVVDARSAYFEKPKLEDVKLGDDRVSFSLKSSRMSVDFEGQLAADGPYAGQVMGIMSLQGSVFPARLEKTRQDKVSDARPTVLGRDFVEARNETDPKARVRKLRDLIAKHPGAPVNHLFYEQLLDSAEAAGLPPTDVESMIATWRGDARPFGPKWTNEIEGKALKAIAPQKAYAETALKLAQELDKSLPADASIETRQNIVSLLAMAAKNAGKADVAAEAESRASKYDAQLDEEYHAKVPPFRPTPYEGRKAAGAGRVAVMELFTGAQCPPCVAADVAFDALLKSYKPTDFIGLQYHLHIPGPDPLTNNDTIARQKYYGSEVRGTPSTFFNGRSDAGGGGGMGASEAKYGQYRELIDKILEEKPSFEVTATAKRTGDEVAIVAEAKSLGDGKPGSASKLRLALTEESIRYVGSNKLRFHHHVVRALPGGAEGTALSDGKGKVEIKLDLADLRKQLQEYLGQAAERRPFPFALPEIALKDLSVVAFVQDDDDKAIVGAVSVPVTTVTP